MRSPEGERKGFGSRVEVLTERILVYTDDGDAFVSKLGDEGIHPAQVLVRRSSLEDVFLRVTGHSIRN